MGRITRIVLIALGITLVYGTILYFIIQEGQKCDEHVVLNDKEEYDCIHVGSYDNGMSSIEFCDGTKMSVPTYRIVKVTKIK